MQRLSVLLAVAALTTTLAPAAGAFHGTPFVVRGTACLADAGLCMPVEVQWGGGSTGNYRFLFSAPGTGVQLVPITVQAREVYQSVFFTTEEFCPRFLEIALFTGKDTSTGGDVLSLAGTQKNCMGDGTSRRITLAGHLLAFDLDLAYANR